MCGTPLCLPQSNFGPVGGNITVEAWASPVTDDSLVFLATNCSVIEAHVTISCVTGPAMGGVLSWLVVVEGQRNGVPISSTAPPVITSVGWADAGVTHAATTGGTRLRVVGDNLGFASGAVVVTLTTSFATLTTTSCRLATPHEEVVCVMPQGTGVLVSVTVSVLGQATTQDLSGGLAYAPPVLSAVQPSVWPSDVDSGVAVTVSGTGFGGPTQAPFVTVTVHGSSVCGDVEVVVLVAQSVTVRSDSELAFVVRGVGSGITPLLPTWHISVNVSGQVPVLGPVDVHTRAPSVPTLTFESPSNGTHYFVVLTGADYGPAVSSASCGSGVDVGINGRSCDALTMTVVRRVCVQV
jgi:hypothetical protein